MAVNMTAQNMTISNASLAMMEAQLANMTSQAQVLEGQLADAVQLSAKVLRLSCSVFVFLMQVSATRGFQEGSSRRRGLLGAPTGWG